MTHESAEPQVGVDEFAAGIRRFDRLWARLAPPAQAELLSRLVQQVDYDGRAGRIAIQFHPAVIAQMATDAEPQEILA